MKHQVNWNTVGGALQNQPWHNIWSADNPVEVLSEHLPFWLDVMYPRSIRVHNKNKPWFDDQAGVHWP